MNIRVFSRSSALAVALACSAVLVFSLGCGGSKSNGKGSAPDSSTSSVASTTQCVEEMEAGPLLPGVRTEHQELQHWLEALASRVDPKQLLLSEEQVQALNAALAAEEQGATAQYPLNRESLIAKALAKVGSAITSQQDRLDGSNFIQELFAGAGVRLPAFSESSQVTGSFHFEVQGSSEQAKLETIEQAAQSGAVILHTAKQVMFYLGRDTEALPMVVLALNSYQRSCGSGTSETKVQVGLIRVASLELGKGTKSKSLLEEVSKITVIGQAPSKALYEQAVLRPGAATRQPSRKECRKLSARRIFLSPERPVRGRALRAIATTRKRLGPTTISFFDGKGRRQESTLTQTGGPPQGFIGAVDAQTQGNWMAVLGDGSDLYGCRSFQVKRPPPARKAVSNRWKRRKRPEPLAEVDASEVAAPVVPVWSLKRKWNSNYEDLFATFTERLFDYPSGEDITWPNLHSILQDSERNILFDHNGDDEENNMKLVPDCADLPYTLRAYFAWKLRLPFAVHECRRAKEGRPPKCEVGESNLISRAEFKAVFAPEQDRETKIFEEFINRHVRRAVHSSSGRTGPKDSTSDFYPVPLSRKALRPGTVFNDPYGHLLVVVDWLPQGSEGYGALIGADAQPDGTIGRRRFWRGSFLFRPETRSGGAGFKAFRPWGLDRSSGRLVSTPNDKLKKSSTARYSTEQYRGSESDFYDKMEALINPRALDPIAKMRSLVDALEEQVTRRGTSVKTGEDFMKSRNFSPIDMPKGSKIFLTSGPWEDFSTPSRDWRLLIAIHTVVDFPEAVRRTPKQYGVDPASADARANKLKEELAKTLAGRPFSYLRSDGSTWKLTLKDLVDRRVDFEMSYNPNDCPELRWAAPEASEEVATCKRHAPPEQRSKMREYRNWFSERRRPAS